MCLMQVCPRCSSITATCLRRVAQGVLKRIERPLQHSLQKLLTVMMEAPAGLPAGLRGQGYNLIYQVSRQVPAQAMAAVMPRSMHACLLAWANCLKHARAVHVVSCLLHACEVPPADPLYT